jgi:uncharacterized protein (TIGR03083 family)
MTDTQEAVIDVTATAPLTHAQGMALFAAELQRNLDLMRRLDGPAWSSQTECPDWDVRRMYLHVLGAVESGASTRELMHQMLTARRYQKANGGPLEAALSATQVAERIDLSPAELVTRFETVEPVTVRKRTKMPSLLRKATMKVDGPVVEKWSLGYLIDTIYLRDAWMHRVDVTRATGSALVLTPDHDGRIVADVVAEWARRHGQPFTLRLDGPAGGVFASHRPSPGDPVIELDAVEFCRVLAGRSDGSGLLTTIVPF